MRTGRMLRNCRAPAMGLLGTEITRRKPHSQSRHQLCSRGRTSTDQISWKPSSPFLQATSPLPALDPFKNHSFLFKEEQKYINKSNKEPLVSPKGGEKNPQPLHPASGRSC